MNMKSIVTGGAGFVGSHLVNKLLGMNHKIIVLDNFSTGRRENLSHIKKKIKLINCDISKKGNWTKDFKNADWVFHFAGLADIIPSIQNPEEYFKSNVNGTLNVLQACRKSKLKKFIYAASSSCYGIPKKYPTPDVDTNVYLTKCTFDENIAVAKILDFFWILHPKIF